MAKTSKVKTSKPEPEKNAVVPLRPPKTPAVNAAWQDVDAATLAEMEDSAGEGLSRASSDNMIPILYVLQPLSPQLDHKSEAYVEGAEEGDIYLRGSPEPLVKTSQGGHLFFQSCVFYKEWGEWIPRDEGGGFVGRHQGDEDNPPAGARRAEGKKRGSVVYKMGENELKFYRNFIGFIIRDEITPEPYVLPLTSTGHTVAKSFMRIMNSQPPLPSGKPPASWTKMYKVTTKERRNPSGRWYVLVFEDIGDEGFLFGDPEAIRRGKSLGQAFKSGAVKAADYEAVSEPQGDDSSDAESAGL